MKTCAWAEIFGSIEKLGRADTTARIKKTLDARHRTEQTERQKLTREKDGRLSPIRSPPLLLLLLPQTFSSPPQPHLLSGLSFSKLLPGHRRLAACLSSSSSSSAGPPLLSDLDPSVGSSSTAPARPAAARLCC